MLAECSNHIAFIDDALQVLGIEVDFLTSDIAQVNLADSLIHSVGKE